MDIEDILTKQDPEEAFFALLKCAFDEPYKHLKERIPDLVRIILKNPELCFHTLYSSGIAAGRDPETLRLGESFLSDELKKLMLTGVTQGGPQWISETLRQVFLTEAQRNWLLGFMLVYGRGTRQERYWIRETLKWGRLKDDEKKMLIRALRKKK